ncbi:MAG: FtsX-like permease family protein [Erysipelotrichia bacterium]|nr:FtsX-like permease family protein [Erysipelotrichia bacterium]
MFKKDTYRLIKKTFKRFFSLVSIVFIGVAFMMGLFSTAPIMRASVEQYYDETNLHDIQIYSSYGFCAEDIETIKNIEGIKDVYASKFKDVYAKSGDKTEEVIRLRELNSTINKYTLKDGRLPQKDDEVLALERSGYAIGDDVEVYLINDDIKDYVKEDKFKVVGIVDSSEYMAKFMSVSLLDNKDLNGVLYLRNDCFVGKYYTTVYCTVDRAVDSDSFMNKYQQLIDEEISEVQLVAAKQEGYLKEQLLKDYQKEIDDGYTTLNTEKINGQKQLDEAKQQLDEALIKLIIGETEIETNENTLNSSEKLLKEKEELVNSSLAQVDQAIAQIEEEQGKSFEEVYQQMKITYQTYKMLQQLKDNYSGSQNIQQLKQQNEKLHKEIEQLQLEQQEKNDELAIVEEKISQTDDPVLLEQLQQQREALNKEIADLTVQIELKNTAIKANEELIKQLENMDDSQYQQVLQDLLDKMDASAGGSVEESYVQLTKLYESKQQLTDAQKEIVSGKQQIEEGRKQIAEAKKTLATGKSQYESGLQEYNDGVITFQLEIEEAENKLKLAQQKLDELPSAGWTVLDRDSHYSSYMYRGTVKQMRAIGIVMPMLFYLVAALVCMTTMTRLVDEQRGQIGIFRALGFSKKQIICKYLVYAFSASIIGAFFGIFVGIALFPTVIYTCWRLMYYLPDIKIFFPIISLLISIAAFSLLMMAVTGIVVNSSLKEAPSQLMRPKAPKNAKKVFLENIGIIWNNLSFTGKITARNLIRYKTRFFMTVIGVAGCTSLLVLGFGIKDSIGDIVNIQYSDIFNYNCNVYLENDNSINETVELLEKDLDNEQVVPIMNYSSKVYLSDDDPTINVEVLDARKGNDIFNLYDRKTNEKLKINNRGVIVSEKFAINNNLKAGDMITIESKNGIKAQVKIEAICKMYFQHYLYISEDLYKDLFSEKIHYTMIAVRNTDGHQKLTLDLKNVDNISSITDFSAFTEQFNTMIEALDIIIAVIIITAGSLAFVVLINLTQVNISERTREIATLKVLGFRDKEVNSYLFKEIILLTVIGGIIGMPLGKIEEGFVMDVINMEMVMFPHNIKLLSYLVSFAITFVFTLIVLNLTKKPLKEIQMVESLKSVE